MLIALVPLEYCFPFTVNKTNMVHVDDNLASSQDKNWTASHSSTLMAELDCRNPNSQTRKGLTCYDCCHYITQSDTDGPDKNTAEKHLYTRWHFERGEICAIFFSTVRLLCVHYHTLKEWYGAKGKMTRNVQRMEGNKCSHTSCKLHCWSRLSSFGDPGQSAHLICLI